MHDTDIAKQFLKNHQGEFFHPGKIKDTLGLRISESALGRRLRDAAAKNEVQRGEQDTESGRKVAVYSVPSPLFKLMSELPLEV